MCKLLADKSKEEKEEIWKKNRRGGALKRGTTP